MKTIDLSFVPFPVCPSWYRNIAVKARELMIDTNEADVYQKAFMNAAGFDIKLKFIQNEGIRIIEGEESEIMMMILKWS